MNFDNGQNDSQPSNASVENSPQKKSWVLLLGVSLLVALVTATLTWGISKWFSRPVAMASPLIGYYIEQKPEGIIEKDGNFGYRAVGTTFIVSMNSPNGKLQAVEHTTWEIYFYSDPKDENSKTKIGGYTAEWVYTQTNAATPSSNDIIMEGKVNRRAGLESESLDKQYLPNDEVRKEYANQIKSLQESFSTVRSEVHFATDSARITRKNWYNGKQGEPDDTSIFIRENQE